jgi:hypothetical protein
MLVDGALVGWLRERDEQLARLQDELLARSEAAATWQARAGILAAQLAQAQGRIRALEAPSVTLDAPGRAPDAETSTRTDGPAQYPKRAWWRFWR